MSFKEWEMGYEKEYERELKELYEKHPDYRGFIPEGLDKRLIQHYSAYRSELTTKRLVRATWFLAIGTLILSIITLFTRAT